MRYEVADSLPSSSTDASAVICTMLDVRLARLDTVVTVCETIDLARASDLAEPRHHMHHVVDIVLTYACTLLTCIDPSPGLTPHAAIMQILAAKDRQWSPPPTRREWGVGDEMEEWVVDFLWPIPPAFSRRPGDGHASHESPPTTGSLTPDLGTFPVRPPPSLLISVHWHAF